MLVFVQQYFTTVVAALVIMGFFYVFVWVLLGGKLKKYKIQLSKRAGWPQIKGEIGATLVSFIGGTAFMLMVLALKDHGFTQFYVEERFGWYELFTVLLMILISDAWFYWFHRAMHHPRVYKYVHALHHRSLDVNPFTSTSFHVVESVLLTIWILPLVVVLPISMTALGIVQALGTMNNLKSHLGYELFPRFFSKKFPFNIFVTATNHSLHHTQYDGNYGLFFRFWDLICGTELPVTISTFDDIHLRKDELVLDNTKFRTLEIDKLVRENSRTVSVYFKPTDVDFYRYKAGQYLTLKVMVHGQVYYRCFSLSSSPELDSFLRITIRLKGKVSHHFYYDAKVGERIEALLPVGEFNLKSNLKDSNQYFMVAGGSGITPIYSMIKQILVFEPHRKLTLLYANSNEEHIIFKEELKGLANQYHQFKYIDFISGQNRIEKHDLISDPNTVYYVCGPDSLKKSITRFLNELSIDRSKINFEYFADGYLPWFGLRNRQG
jgi:ferredoxin-NADP reductase/sterol desaturase/sphingolipid hydroxylase (fatty acid hydroxylase superfamily)